MDNKQELETKEVENKPNFYSVIPACVRYDSRLSPSEILLYGDISSLCNKDGYCWASNSYFSKLWNKDKATISRWVSKLKSCGHIRTKVVYKQGTKEIESRYIYITKELG